MKGSEVIPQHLIENKILFIRNKKVMLDRDLAMLYGVETRVLNQAVRRNIKRFPEDFMFQLTKEEMDNWKSQIVMTNKEKMGIRRRSFLKYVATSSRGSWGNPSCGNSAQEDPVETNSC